MAINLGRFQRRCFEAKTDRRCDDNNSNSSNNLRDNYNTNSSNYSINNNSTSYNTNSSNNNNNIDTYNINNNDNNNDNDGNDNNNRNFSLSMLELTNKGRSCCIPPVPSLLLSNCQNWSVRSCPGPRLFLQLVDGSAPAGSRTVPGSQRCP